MELRWSILVDYAPLFWRGLLMTLLVTAVAIACGLLLGTLVGLLRSTEDGPKPRKTPAGRVLHVLLIAARWLAKLYVGFFRGTPLVVQILLMHFALMPLIINSNGNWLLDAETASHFRREYGAFFSGTLAMALNAGAYISEIIRGGIQSIHRGQTQAAWSLGMTHSQTMRTIVLPQAFRRMVPALINEGVTLIKDSSLVSAISLAEITFAAKAVAGHTARYWEPYLAISLIYLILTSSLAWLGSKLEVPDEQRGR